MNFINKVWRLSNMSFCKVHTKRKFTSRDSGVNFLFSLLQTVSIKNQVAKVVYYSSTLRNSAQNASSTTCIRISHDGSSISWAGESFIKLLKTKASVNLKPMFIFCPCVFPLQLTRQSSSVTVLDSWIILYYTSFKKNLNLPLKIKNNVFCF